MLLFLAIIAGLVASLAVLAVRWAVEASYRGVEIILDGIDWEQLAAREGKDPVAFLTDARAHGATAIAIYEHTLKRLAERGEVTYLSTGEIQATARVQPLAPAFQALLPDRLRPRAVYIAGLPATLDFLDDAFRGLLGSSRVHRVGPLLEVLGLKADLEEIGVGFRPEDLDRYRRAGLRPVLRLRNYDGLTREGLRDKVAHLTRLGRGYPIVFELTEVLGFDRLISETADALKAAGDPYGRIEVFNVKRKQRGEDRLGERMRAAVIRLFSLTPDELMAMTPDDARDKFMLAARERNIRLLYLRPVELTAGVVATEANLQFLSELTQDLRRFGLHPGGAVPLPEVHVSRLFFLGTALGALATVALLGAILGDAVGTPVPSGWVWGFLIAGLLLTAGLIATGPLVLWRKLLALGVALATPVFAVASAFPHGRREHPVVAGLRTLWLASAISAAGGVLVAALLTEWNFMMAGDVFLGVKVSQVIPVVLVPLLLALRDRRVRHWRDAVAELWAWSSRPLLLRYAIMVVAVGLAAVVLLLRSGNFGLPVLAFEERLRSLAENLLIVRPRTKEYLIGHPALMLAAAAAVAGWRIWVLPLAAVGTVGQAGLVNSFSHIHTPLLYTIWRTVNALLLGSILGAAAIAVLIFLVRLLAGSRQSAGGAAAYHAMPRNPDRHAR